MDTERESWSERTSDREWVLARQHAAILLQAIQMHVGMASGTFVIRDRSMADNVEWILETEPPGTRVVLWAHNGHVSRRGGIQMGSHLSERLGEDYVNVGFAFNAGSFQAKDGNRLPASGTGPVEHTVGPAPEETIGATFSRTGHPIFALDLRNLPDEGVVGKWFSRPHPMRQIGAVFFSEDRMLSPIVLQQNFDAVIFVDRTTRARPVRREKSAER